MLTHDLLPAEPHRSRTYTLWVTSRDPGAESAAAALLDEVSAAVSSAYPKMGRCLERLRRPASGLPPAHLPWFWDTVAHRLLGYPGGAAAKAYSLARKAEQEHALPVDPAWRRANALLFAAHGALPVKELSEHQRWLAGQSAPAEAHAEYVRVLTAWAASPGDLPADLARRIGASARAAGLGTDEDARVLGQVLGAARGKAVPDALLEAAAGPLGDHPQGPRVQAALLDLFPDSRKDAAAWLRLLLRGGIVDAAAAGQLEPEGGLAGWLGRYTRTYRHQKVAYGGVASQPMPAELFEIVSRFAPRLRAAGTPVVIHEDKYRWPALDADLLDACLAEGIEVADPGDAVRLTFWDDRSRRDLRALAAHPVFGRRLEGTVHEGLRGSGTAITRLPRNAGIAAEVHSRIEGLLAALRGGGLAAADEAVTELSGLLDRPTADALDGIEEALAALDLTGPLARALRAGLPEELGWPALDAALEEFDPADTLQVTCTWPVLTVFGGDRAVAVDPSGARARCSFRVPEEATSHAVHYVGGQFLVSWRTGDRYSSADQAYWTDRPEEVFTPEDRFGLRPYGGLIRGGFGYQFETPDRGGRFDGRRVLRPGGREGIGGHEFQLSDGRRFFGARVFHTRGNWTPYDPATGAPAADRTLPDFHRDRELPPGMEEFEGGQYLAVLPEDAPPSPFGQDGRLVGCRVLNRTPHQGPSPTEFLLETVDGRTARYRSRRFGRHPWGIMSLPEGGEDAVTVGEVTVRCHAAADNSLLWQVHGFVPPSGRDRDHPPTLGEAAGPVPPPAFWHFLTPRDERSSKALRTIGDATVRALLDAARDTGDDDALRDRVTRLLPEAGDARVRDGVVRAARLAADVLRRRKELSRRVGIMRSGPVVTLSADIPDTALVPALSGLLPDLRPYEAHGPERHPGTLTAIAADGRFLRGEIDDETRGLAPPARPAEWQVLLGAIDAAAWRAAVETTPEAERTALNALLRTWSRQPFAEPGGTWRTGRAPQEELTTGTRAAAGPARGGLRRFVQPATAPAPAGTEEEQTVTVTRDDGGRLTRLLELVEENGPVPLTPEALAVFSWRTGVRRPVATLALAGLPRRAGHDDHARMLRSRPYKANRTTAAEYDGFWHRLGPHGRRRMLAAGVPEDPADLWTADGPVRAAERMAAVWAELLGTRPYVDEELADALEADLGLPADWARALPAGRPPAEPGGHVLVGSRTGRLHLHQEEPDGRAGAWIRRDRAPHTETLSVIAWALTERPVGDPAAEEALKLYEGLRAWFAAPWTLVELVPSPALARAAAGDPAFRPFTGTLVPCPEPLLDTVPEAPTALEDGTFVVAVPSGDLFLRTAALAEPERAARARDLCDRLDLPGLQEEVTGIRALLDGLGRMAARAAGTPVPAGGYEANPALSAPALVAEVARRLGVGADAAALHLQLRALARPTDRNVRRWNGWSAARHKAAQAELVAVGAVETGRRARAGRTAFAPGTWETLDAPHLPVESDKLGTHGAVRAGKGVHGPFTRLLSPVPLHELFARAAEH
ncbi:hypothetical protein [Streptomyces cinerochromogenes]|uniref:hypothetical protein n=1 Tax=Streptomyces cinerochromogenes TaxID=66422 RepID=UPI0016716F23|nr:hypothetical protein [Streptomyces cinerochromogenes]GGS77716.1 hypothetical protein GCM10010206_45310 [Streptomyces cinerochromogenes]